MKKKAQDAARSKTNKPPLYLGTIRRPWAELPPDAIVLRTTAAAHAGVNIRTIQRHVDRGLLPNGTVTKSDVDRWLASVAGTLKPGAPFRRRLAHARQRVLPLGE